MDGCDICRAQEKKGSRKKVSLGYFHIDRCLVSFSSDNDINRMLPYFWHWKATNSMMYPDNKGRYFQPSKLLEAFSICGYMCNKREQIEVDNANNLKK